MGLEAVVDAADSWGDIHTIGGEKFPPLSFSEIVPLSNVQCKAVVQASFWMVGCLLLGSLQVRLHLLWKGISPLTVEEAGHGEPPELMSIVE